MKKRWPKLTDDDLRRINGNRDLLSDVLSERYALPQDQAEQQIDEYEDTEVVAKPSKS
jgi:uncharacterized protein YjbJ (UPF0337 family)